MPSTSISQPAVRRAPARRHHGSAQSRAGELQPATSRPVQPGADGLGQRRERLEALWRERLERVTALSLAYHDAAQYSQPGQPGSRAAARRVRQLARQTVTERQTLVEIEAALDRLAAGRYGWCEQCGRPIAAALLGARPQARYCAACGRQPGQRASQEW